MSWDRVRRVVVAGLSGVGLLAISLTCHAVDFRDLPADRFPPAEWSDITWDDPGGWTTVDVSTLGITPGSSTVAQDLQTALDGATTPTVFLLPAGTYTLTAGLSMRSNTILRGEGADSTRLLLTGSAGTIEFSGGWDPVQTTITADIAAGSTVVPVADASELEVGQLIRIEQDLEVWEADWGRRGHGQHVFITGKSGNDLTVDMPLALPYSTARNPEVARPALVENAGIERLAIERTAYNDTETVFIKRAHNVFVQFIESYNTAKIHVFVSRSRRIIIRGNYIHHAWNYGGGGHGYGVDLMANTTRAIVTNNVFETLRHHWIYANGANHCIVSYNLNVDIGNPDNSISDGCGHGHYANHNLFEGNVAWWFFIDNVWGAAGPENTFFRNRALGQTASWHQGEGIAIEGNADRENVIANVLSNDSTLFLGPDVDDEYVEGNVVSGAAEWNTLSSTSELPPSLYLECAPSFWTDGEPWPPYGPDVGAVGQLPAEVRYAAGQPVAEDTGTGASDCGAGGGGQGAAAGGGMGGAGGVGAGAGGGMGGAGGVGASGAAGGAGGPAATANGSNESGCGCRLDRPQPLGGWAVLAALTAGLGWLSRRRQS